MATKVAAKQATVVCPFCGTLNRVNLERLADRPKCGNCGRPILLDRPSAVSDATLDSVLAGTDVPVVLDCYADWCGPCKVMAPVLDDLARDRQGSVLVAKIDTDRNPNTVARFGIRAIPTLLALRHGREVGRHAGVVPRRELDLLVDAAGGAGDGR
jgi:thioredoxin 2